MSKKQERTLRDLNHRQLVWVLYCARGLLGNLEHAVAVNAYTMDRNDLRAVERLRKRVEAETEALAQHIASKAQ